MLKRFRHELVVTFILQAVAMVFAAAFQVLSARWLGAAGRGELAILVSAAQITAMVCGLGLPGAISFYAASTPESVPLLARRQVALLGAVTLVVGAALAASHYFSLHRLLRGVEVWFTVYTVGAVAQPAFARLTLAIGAAGVANFTSVVSACGSVLCMAALGARGPLRVSEAMGALSLATLAGAMLPVSHIARRGGFRPTTQREPSWPSELKVGGLGFAASILGLLMFRVDIFLVAALGGGARAAGVYSVGVLAAELLVRAPNWTATVLAPTVSAKPAETRRITIALFWASVGFVGLAALPVVLLPGTTRWVLRIALGTDFVESYAVFVAMLPRIVAQAGGAILFGNLAGRGYSFFHPFACGVGLVVLIACDLVLIPKYGIVGAAIGGGIGYTAGTLVALKGFLALNGLDLRGFLGISVSELSAWRNGVRRLVRKGST